MSSIWIICKKELKGYFASPIAYGLMVFFAVITGYFAYLSTAIFVDRSMQSQMSGRSMPMDLNEWIIRPVIGNVSVVGLFLIPMITMRLFAEEKRTGTIELLTTSPVTDLQVILGKWLAAVLMYAAILGVALLDVALLFAYGTPDLKPLATAFLGLLLQGGALLALGTFISTCTKNQIVAGVATFAVSLLLWVLEWVTAFSTSATGKVLSYLSVVSHFESFAKGILDSKDVIYYLSVIFFGLFLTSRSMESLRWRS